MKAIRNLAVACFGIGVSASLLLSIPVWLELGIRTFRPLYYKYIRKDVSQYYELPGTFDIQQHATLTHTFRPQYLYNGRDVRIHKASNSLRIIAVGGSTTYGMAVGDRNYPRILEEKLNAAGIASEVINAGVTGYNAVDSLVDFETTGIDFGPDFAFWYHGVNDFAQGEKAFADSRDRERVGSHWSHHMYVSTFLRRLNVWNKLVDLTPSFPAVELRRTNIVFDDEPKGEHRFLTLYRRNVESFILVAKANKVTPILGLIATMYGASPTEKALAQSKLQATLPNEADWVNAIQSMNGVLIELSKKHNVPYVKTNSIDGQGKYFWDQSHQSILGHVKQAEEIFEQIVKITGRKTVAL